MLCLPSLPQQSAGCRPPEPAGYARSLREGRNVIAEPHLHEYYDHLSSVIRDPIFAPARLWTIAKLLTGRYEPLLRAYESSPAAAEATRLAEQSNAGD